MREALALACSLLSISAVHGHSCTNQSAEDMHVHVEPVLTKCVPLSTDTAVAVSTELAGEFWCHYAVHPMADDLEIPFMP